LRLSAWAAACDRGRSLDDENEQCDEAFKGRDVNEVVPLEDPTPLSERLLLLCQQLQFLRHSSKLGQRSNIQFSHQITAMDLHCGFGDTDIVRNLLVEATRETWIIISRPRPVCTENLVRVDDVMESPKLAE
jgi:hypothetical protein